jgi:hypothetical protein
MAARTADSTSGSPDSVPASTFFAASSSASRTVTFRPCAFSGLAADSMSCMNLVTACAFAASRRASAARMSAIASARRARIASQPLTTTATSSTAKTAATPPTTALWRLANLPI